MYLWREAQGVDNLASTIAESRRRSAGKIAYGACIHELYVDRIEAFNAVYGTGFESFDALAKTENWRYDVDARNARKLYDNTVFLNRTVDQY